MFDVNKAKDISLHLVSLRREFHKFPEPSTKEEKTAQMILAELKAIGGWDIRSGLGNGEHGILADIKGAHDGKTIALRADMDALQMNETTDLPFSSENKGMMHACGHDNHLAVLLGAARIIAQEKEHLHGSVRLIFQPAEELTPDGGAKSMIAAGALDGVDAVYGMHVWPDLPLGTIGVKENAAMAASDHFIATINGKPSHAAKPHDGIDAIVAGAHFVTGTQAIVGRNVNPMKSAVITIGLAQGGTRYNILPGGSRFEGTCRTFDPDVRDLVERRLGEVLHGACAMTSCTGEFEYLRGYCALINDVTHSRRVLSKAAQLFGEEHTITIDEPTMVSEDFAFYLEKVPGAFFWFGTGDGAGGSWPLHNSHYSPSEDILWRGAAMFASLVLDRD